MELVRLMADPPKKRTEQRTCINCEASFNAVIYILRDREVDNDRLCPECEKEKRNQEELAAYQERLEEIRTERRAKWFDTCGMSGTLKTKTFDNFQSKLQPQAFSTVKSYKDRSLILLSPELYGVGKTHLAAALANHLIATRDPAIFEINSLKIRTLPCPVYFTEETLLLARIRDTYNNQGPGAETEETVYRLLSMYPLLIIDDVGKIKPRDMSFTQSVYFRIINQRYNDGKQIVITTNLDGAGLNNHIGGACADRLFEMAGANGFIFLTGKSYRQKLGGLNGNQVNS